MRKRKRADVGPTQAGDSRGRGQNTNKTGNYVANGGKYTQGRKKSTGTIQGSDGRKSDAI